MQPYLKLGIFVTPKVLIVFENVAQFCQGTSS